MAILDRVGGLASGLANVVRHAAATSGARPIIGVATKEIGPMGASGQFTLNGAKTTELAAELATRGAQQINSITHDLRVALAHLIKP